MNGTYEKSKKLSSPFAMELLMSRLQQLKHESFLVREGRLCRAFAMDGSVYETVTEQVGGMEEPEIKITVRGPETDRCGPVIAETMFRMLSADTDLHAFYRFAEREQQLKPVLTAYRGLRQLLDASLFEAMVRTIIAQQMNLTFAASLIRRLCEAANAGDHRTAMDKEQWPLFPTAEQVAAMEPAQLRALQFSVRKAEYVIDFARAVVSGSLDLEGLRTLSNEEVTERLVKLRGIGRWTAECFLLFGLGRHDILPAADIGLRNAVRRVYGLDHQPTEQEVREIGKDWTEWASYITLYLWASLNDGGPNKKQA